MSLGTDYLTFLGGGVFLCPPCSIFLHIP